MTTVLARIARQLGADIHLSEPVEQLTFEGHKATGARTANGEYKADAVVINADFARAMTRMVPDSLRRKWTDSKLSKKRMSCSAYMMYLGVRGTYEDVAHHTIYVAKDYASNMEDIARRHVLSGDPSIYVQNACVTDRSLARPGKSTVYVLVPVTHQHSTVDWQKEAPRYRQLVLRKLESIGLTIWSRESNTSGY